MLLAPVQSGGGRSPIFLRDTFTGAAATHLAAHSPEIGGAWALEQAGLWELNGSRGIEKISTDGGTQSLTRNAARPSVLPYTMACSWIYNGSAVGTPQIGWSWCNADASNYAVLFYDLPSGTWFGYKQIAGVFTNLFSQFQNIVGAGGTLHVLATITAAQIQWNVTEGPFIFGPFNHGLNGLDGISTFYQGTPGGIGTDIQLGPILATN